MKKKTKKTLSAKMQKNLSAKTQRREGERKESGFPNVVRRSAFAFSLLRAFAIKSSGFQTLNRENAKGRRRENLSGENFFRHLPAFAFSFLRAFAIKTVSALAAFLAPFFSQPRKTNQYTKGYMTDQKLRSLITQAVRLDRGII